MVAGKKKKNLEQKCLQSWRRIPLIRCESCAKAVTPLHLICMNNRWEERVEQNATSVTKVRGKCKRRNDCTHFKNADSCSPCAWMQTVCRWRETTQNFAASPLNHILKESVKCAYKPYALIIRPGVWGPAGWSIFILGFGTEHQVHTGLHPDFSLVSEEFLSGYELLSDE